ncbi:LacI family transcriptional regulator [Puniceicoccales bacterium CK1056]|uniref:LacI family transcriptional regulator n=1 Tax=Oceanipulchritudo coccoides TaxID=2706888 RepID=A0A6B2M2M1_9BACT|nr:LacI family DNA-binding transcriptional regulator [Oceanipulchritudo coccoides]NDV63198.1 LacI family transcriptional regulator [Oceanipulchritudo coccoides]
MDTVDQSGKRITVRDIAKAAGVSHSTVSRALQGSPLVRKETRSKLVKLAEKMGYRPDPMLSALTAYRSRVQLRKQRDALAFVVGPYVVKGWEDIIQSAHERAERLGFDLQEYIWKDDLSPTRQSEIIRSRGVKGIIVGPLTKENHLIELPLRINYFSFVAIGRFISHPRINTVTPNHFGSVRQAMDVLRAKGYKRIGLALLERLNFHVDDRIRTAYLGYQSYLPDTECVPMCHPSSEECETSQILQWYEEERPDAILSYNHIYDHLVEAGIRIPEDVAFASLNLNSENENRIAGTNVNDQMVGQVAVNLLNSQLLIGEIGEPEIRQTLIVDTFWEDGPTAPSLRLVGKALPAEVNL